METAPKLSLEQQFKLEMLKDQIRHLTREQAHEYLLEVFRQNMIKDNLLKQLLKQS